MEEKKSLITPKVREALKAKLKEYRENNKIAKVEPIDAELVDETSLEVVKKKPKFMDLATSEHYLKTFMDKTPQEISDFIDRQSDVLMMYSKNAAMELLAKAVDENDNDAMEMYLKVIQASAVVAQEKVAVKKLIGVQPEDAPKPFKAEELSPEEWEKKFKPGQQVVQIPATEGKPEETVWVGPTNKSVN